jgi:TetR/AcrR family transcriptional regulator, lmrAB and yxaGH operons repressor
MSKGEATRQRMIEACAALIEHQGYHATGLNQILRESQTPRGSLYFHFPGGKEELGAAAIAWRAADIEALLASALDHSPSAQSAMIRIISAMADRLQASDWTKGCPVATVALEASDEVPALQQAAAQAYARWQTLLAARLIADGHPEPMATQQAELAIAAMEGALLLARVQRSRAPLDRLASHVPLLLVTHT